MKLFVMFGQRAQDYEGQYAPEALDFIWDEYCVEENPQGFDEATKAAEEKSKKDGFVRTRLVTIEVNQGKIERLLNAIPEVAGTVVEET